MLSLSSVISIKIVIDFLVLGLLGCSYFLPIFEYDSDFEVGIIELKYNFHSDGLSAYVISKYSEFDDHLCKSEISFTKKVCDKIDNFKIAGECFLIMTSFGGILIIYGMMNLIGKIFYCTARGCLHLDFTHYIPSIIFLIALGVYCLVCELGSISYSPKLGLFSQFASVLLAFSNMLFYCCYKKRINAVTDEFNEKPLIKSTNSKPKKNDPEEELEVSNPNI